VQQLTRRLARVRDSFPAAQIDALLVSHLPNIRYLTGFVGSAGALVVTPSHCVLSVDFRYATAARGIADAWGGAIDVAVSERSADATAASTLRDLEAARVGIEAAHMTVAACNALTAALAVDQTTVATDRIVERIRAIKDADEIAILREAGARLSGVARELRRFVAAGRSERAIARDIDDAMRDAGFERPAFETIVASGPNSALPHARPTARLLQDGEGTVLDFGGVYDGYCVDLTRTVTIGARSEAFRRIFAAVAEAQAAAIAAVRPGVRASAIDAAARDVLAGYGLGEAFGHGTGHGLGLEVHEDPRLARPSSGAPDVTVEEGMVFTIEPGAYVPGTGGVRIEDDVLVGLHGAELLTDVPIEL
jgi:Xaa-Pro aminopeptidase